MRSRDIRRPSATVVIPTLQRAPELKNLLRTLADHPRVGEILVINNAATPLGPVPEKVQVIDLDENIFVNPAWNLGAELASHEYLVLANDDIEIDPELVTYGLTLLDRRLYPLIGVHPGFVGSAVSTRPRHRPADRRTPGFGVLMFLPRRNYVPVPEPAKIFYGDDWLYLQQRRTPGTVLGHPLRTQMSVSSGSAEFDAVKVVDGRWWERVAYPELWGSRGWHRRQAAIGHYYEFNRRWKTAWSQRSASRAGGR